MLSQGQILVISRALHDVTAELAGVAVAHVAQEPACLPAIAAVRQLGGVDHFALQRADALIVVAGLDIDAGGFEPRHVIRQALLGASGGDAPAGGFQQRERPRLRRQRRRVRPLQTGRTGIAADARYDLVGDLPGVFERSTENAGAALALIVVAALAVERVDGRLETDAAAIARRPHRRRDYLRAERAADDAGGDRGRRATRRAAWGVRRIPRIARTARL